MTLFQDQPLDFATNDVVVEINGVQFPTWQSLSVTRDKRQQAASFNMSVSDVMEGGQTLAEAATLIDPLSEVLITLARVPIVRGLIDDVNVSLDANSHSVSVSGRSVVADIIDGSVIHETGAFRQQAPRQIIEALLKPYQIPLEIDEDLAADFDKPLPNHQVTHGEPVFSEIEKLSKLFEATLSDLPNGSIRVSKGGDAIFGESLDQPGRIARCSAPRSGADRHSHYIVSGQQAVDAETDEDSAHVEEAVKDPTIKRYRPLVIHPLGAITPEEARRRLIHLGRERFRTTNAVTLTVPGWIDMVTQAPFAVGVKHYLTSKILKFSGPYECSKVVFKKSGSGTQTDLTMDPTEDPELEAMDAEEARDAESQQGD